MNAPMLRQDLMYLWEAFSDLSTCRYYHMGGEGPIPWTAMQLWADWWGFKDMDDQAFFSRVLRRVDNWYLDYRARQSEAKQSKVKSRGAR